MYQSKGFSSVQIVVDSFNLKMDSAQHQEGWSGSVTDVLGVIKGSMRLLALKIRDMPEH